MEKNNKEAVKISSSRLPISSIVITYNEESNIEDCLESLDLLSGEIFVVDSGSSDRTMELAGRHTKKIYSHPFENFAQQRNWAQDNLPIKNDWVLHLDADERVSPELAREVKKAFSQGIDVDGFMMPRRTVFRGRWIKHGGHYPVYHMRIFKKNKGKSEERLYDQNYIVHGRVSELKGDIINIINPDLGLWKSRHRRWARLEAEEVLLNKGRVLNIGRKGNPIEKRNWFRYALYYRMPLFIRAIVYFVYRYFIRLGFLDGRQGFIFHFWHGLWYRLLVDREIFKLRKEKR